MNVDFLFTFFTVSKFTSEQFKILLWIFLYIFRGLDIQSQPKNSTRSLPTSFRTIMRIYNAVLTRLFLGGGGRAGLFICHVLKLKYNTYLEIFCYIANSYVLTFWKLLEFINFLPRAPVKPSGLFSLHQMLVCFFVLVFPHKWNFG